MFDSANLLQEVSMLSKTPRSGFAFLGSGDQSVAEHSYTAAFVGWVLAERAGEKAMKDKVILFCLLHDLAEARTGDLNYVNKRYVVVDEDAAIKTLLANPLLGGQLQTLFEEYNLNLSIEAQLAHDADQIELLIMLKQLQEAGNKRTASWIEKVFARVKTKTGIKLAEEILNTPSDGWWQE